MSHTCIKKKTIEWYWAWLTNGNLGRWTGPLSNKMKMRQSDVDECRLS